MSTQKLNSKQVKDILTNVISKTAEKSVSQGNYDRTILATIQYCIDKTSGQYRIKYQNGYYTAYGQNKDYIYSEGSSVFVLVPQGNFKHKLFITGSASTSSSDKVYLTNLEDDQIYKARGKNILTYTRLNAHDLDLSSYLCGETMETEYVKYYYRKGSSSNCINVDSDANIFKGFKQSKYFKLGVRLKTNLADSRKGSGDYGIRVVIRFKNSKEVHDETYEINTFMMSGAPFEFTQFVPQTAYFPINEDFGEMIEIREIAGFTRLFPHADNPPGGEDIYDIFVDDISIQSAVKLYDTSNDSYRVNIDGPNGLIFDDSTGVLPLTATLYELGNEVKGDGLEYYWGKRDATVDSVSNPHYCEHLGQGWYCLNSSTLKKSDDATVDNLKTNSIKTYTPEETNTYTSDKLSFVTNLKDITVSKNICRAKATDIICVVRYGGTNYSSQITTLTNPDGYYLLVGAQDNQTVHYNGVGYFTIAAGVFYDVEEETRPNNSKVLSTSNPRIVYKWTEHKDGIATRIPITNPTQILQHDVAWSSEYDNEDIEDVSSYLATDSNLEYCIERYNYYKQQADYYGSLPIEERTAENTKLTTCVQRRDGIIIGKLTEINSLFNTDNLNELGNYILGPSIVTAEYLADGQQPYVNAKINSITPLSLGPAVYNTIYKIPAAKIGTQTTYEVSAVLTDSQGTFGLGSQMITLTNEAGSSLDYSVEIVNGQQNFMYDERGISPTSDNAIQKIAIQPLSFILRNKEGEILYDSAAPDKYPDIDINDLKPVWKFHDSNYSLIVTNYQEPVSPPTVVDDTTPKYAVKSDDFDSTHIWKLRNESYFYYKLREDYNNNYVNSSNVELQLRYNGSFIFGSTNFTFTKQGDLGTNGTNKTLSIYSGTYNNYKNNVLSQAKYCNFNTKVVRESSETEVYDANVRHYSPDERHLGKPYLFATKSYASAGSDTPCSLVDGKYVNLHISQQPYNNGAGITPSTAGTFQVRWSQSSDDDTSLNEANWKIPDGLQDNGEYNFKGWRKIGNRQYYYSPNITLNQTSGPSINASVVYVSEGKAERPSPHNYSDSNNSGTFIGNNIISVNAKMFRPRNGVQDSTDPSLQEISTFAYCALPYYYINWDYYGSGSMDYVDPARHIVLVGGFDQVVYNSEGKNPYYSGDPFRFYLFDKDGKDITYNVIAGAKAGTSTISWSCSPGLQANPQSQLVSNIKSFSSLANTINIGQICSYNGSYFRCINNHDKSLSNVVEYGNGEKTTYAAGSFIPAWWEEIDINTYWQSMQFIPCATYESLIEQDLFNSWVRLYIRHGDYEAEAFIPINVYCNCYESPELNAWDGKSLVMNDDGDFSYVIANKVSAGIKDDQNHFIGLSMGQNIRYVSDGNGQVTPKEEIGLFGFGYGKKRSDVDMSDEHRTKQTLFIDAETGKAAFGVSGASQIILDPDPQHWSRLAGWYFSRNFLYKPAAENPDALENSKYKNLHDNELTPNGSSVGKSFGIYVPYETDGDIPDDTIAMWAGQGRITEANGDPSGVEDAEFRVTYGGHLYATGAVIKGDVTAESGAFGNGNDKILINPPVDSSGNKYILKHENFWVKAVDDPTNPAEVGVKGRILAKSGKIGDITATDGSSTEAVFIWYPWYPWRYPTDTEVFNDTTCYPNTTQGQNTDYIFYHPNFHITKGYGSPKKSEVFVRGKIYSEEGRVGGWVIKSNQLMSVDNSTNPTILYSNGNAKFGGLDLYNTGAINDSSKAWWITSAGEAHFTNNGNMFKASKVEVGTTVIESGHGLYLEVGESFRIGDTASLTAVTGQGFVFAGGSSRFDCDLIMNNKDILLQSGSSVYATTGSGNVTMSENGFQITGPTTYGISNTGSGRINNLKIGTGNSYYWDNAGNIYVNNLNANNININGDTIEAYIRNIISAVFNGDVVTDVAVGSTADVQDINGITQTVVKSITKTTKHI